MCDTNNQSLRNNQQDRLDDEIAEVVDTANRDAERLHEDISNSLEMRDLVG